MDRSVVAAAFSAWPGNAVLTRFRRQVALELAVINQGPVGPNSVLSARLGSLFRAKWPRLVAETCALCSPNDGRLRIKQLIAHGEGSFDGDGPEDDPGGAFLVVIDHGSDACVVLHLAGLLRWHAAGCPAGPRTPPSSTAGSAPVLPSRPAFLRAGGSVDMDMSGLVPRYGTPGADRTSPYCANNGGEADAGVVPPSDLALMAFPGPAAASQLRRVLVEELLAATGQAGDGLPPQTLAWQRLSPEVAASRAAAMQPSLASSGAAFRAFLGHRAGAGVLTATRVLRNPADAASSVDCVTLSYPALTRAAVAGIAAAVRAAWPGDEPLQRLKRAAAQVLSTASRTAGPYTLNSGPMGNELKQRQPKEYLEERSANGGLMAKLDERAWGGFLEFVPQDGKEGCLRLRLCELLRVYPPDTGQDLGLVLPGGPAIAAPAAVAATGNGNGAGQPAWGFASAAEFSPAGGGGADPWIGLPPPPQSADQGVAGSGAHVTYAGVGAASLPSGAGDSQLHSMAPQLAAPPAPAPWTVGLGAVTGSAVDAAIPAGGLSTPPVVNSTQQQQQQQVVVLATPTVQWVRHTTEFEAMLRHCYGATQMGLAVHSRGGKAEVAAVYAPGVPGIGVVDAYGMTHVTDLPAAVYLFECSLLVEGDAAVAATPASGLPAAFRALLESSDVTKMVHGCEQAACLAPQCGAATIAPLLDTRVLLQAVVSMLPPLPALPSATGGYMVAGGLAVMTAKLMEHTRALKNALAETGLWADRPELLEALVERHSAALRESMFAVRDWASNPAGHETALVAAARHLPELWEALTVEAVPWVAMAATATAMAAALERQQLCNSTSHG